MPARRSSDDLVPAPLRCGGRGCGGGRSPRTVSARRSGRRSRRQRRDARARRRAAGSTRPRRRSRAAGRALTAVTAGIGAGRRPARRARLGVHRLGLRRLSAAPGLVGSAASVSARPRSRHARREVSATPRPASCGGLRLVRGVGASASGPRSARASVRGRIILAASGSLAAASAASASPGVDPRLTSERSALRAVRFGLEGEICICVIGHHWRTPCAGDTARRPAKSRAVPHLRCRELTRSAAGSRLMRRELSLPRAFVALKSSVMRMAARPRRIDSPLSHFPPPIARARGLCEARGRPRRGIPSGLRCHNPRHAAAADAHPPDGHGGVAHHRRCDRVVGGVLAHDGEAAPARGSRRDRIVRLQPARSVHREPRVLAGAACSDSRTRSWGSQGGSRRSSSAFAILAGARFARWFWWLFELGMTLAFVFVIWLIGQSIFVLGTLCPWCMVTWAVTIPTYYVVTLHVLRSGIVPRPGRHPEGRRRASWAGCRCSRS